MRSSVELSRRGLIPAHAGSTFGYLLAHRLKQAHPRSRGEHGREVREPLGLEGSSPLTRGAQEEGVGIHRSGGLIPAHAGSTLN